MTTDTSTCCFCLISLIPGPLLSSLLLIRSGGGRHLPLFNAFRILFLEQDLDRRGNELQVKKERIILNIGQIELQLVVRCRIVFSVHLA